MVGNVSLAIRATMSNFSKIRERLPNFGVREPFASLLADSKLGYSYWLLLTNDRTADYFIVTEDRLLETWEPCKDDGEWQELKGRTIYTGYNEPL